MIPAGTGFRQFQESEVRYRPEALQAMQAEKEKVLEAAFPLLSQGDGNGKDQPSAAKAAPASLETLLGNKE